MSDLVAYEYPPPRFWEQFEELCADLFEAMWGDPRLVRHGRAGQVQHGVDIVASRGSIYPVGLQCKKKSRWPVKKLTIKEIDHEIDEAENFTPALKEFYLLTTAIPDEALQAHVRMLNEARRKRGGFIVEVLFWPELVRRVARFEQVAKKHFPIRGGQDEFSPLLATWYANDGKLELTGNDWHFAVAELGEDLHDWPTGRVIVRQRETDAMEKELQELLRSSSMSIAARTKRMRLRRELRYKKSREQRIQTLIRMLYSNERLRFYMLDLDESGVDAREILRALIEDELHLGDHTHQTEKIRLSPPSPHLLEGPRTSSSVWADDIPVHMPSEELRKIWEAERDFPKKYNGNKIARVVSELPVTVRCAYAIPAIVRRIIRVMQEDQKSLSQMQLAGYLDLNLWKYTL
ncbi:hypothetical protein EJP67_09790 [Variovorax guangxiensis]|uniref:Uncharacterized protein n=1 Tax=Variovorax guangxiensis TaxID=1775474 RepID=A0A3S0XE88_9BURK|nr:restriction endonuclease [Variovorax guangxiensis]RUR67351.1 hypothetical protein EJP67_09790 [Variovorax guangxiensis]